MSSLLKPEYWVKDHSDYLYSYAITRIFNKDDASDLVQETFFSALKARESFKGDSTERTWLTAILKRKIIDYYRKKATSKETLIEPLYNKSDRFKESGFYEGHWKKDRAPKNWSIETDGMEKDEFQSIFEKCLSFLPPTWAAVFTLKAIEEFSTEEICKELNITASNLWTTIHRSKLQLRDCIEKNWFDKKKRI